MSSGFKDIFENSVGVAIQEMLESLNKLAILVTAAESHGRDKKDTCAFYNDGICTCWCWKSEPRSEPYIIDVVKKGEEWFINPHPIYCALCSAYEEDEEWEEEEEEWEEEWEEEEWEEEEEEWPEEEEWEEEEEWGEEEEEWEEEWEEEEWEEEEWPEEEEE